MRLGRAVAPGLVLLATLLALVLALRTRGFVHPDERLHVAAFQYFTAHLWPPPPNADGLEYDVFGVSKVYSGEVAYPIVGRLAAVLSRASSGRPYWLALRVVDVALLPVTLLALFACGARLVPGRALAIAFVSIPQLLYVFSYANTDAFSIAVSTLLFAYAVVLAERDETWSPASCVLLGALLGCVIGAKDNFVLSLALPAVVLAPRFLKGIGAGRLALVAMVAVAIACPYKVLYPALEPDFGGLMLRQMEERPAPGYKTSDPRLRLPPSGHSAWQVLTTDRFALRTAQSFWGVYGHMNVFAPPAAYAAAGVLGGALVGLTLHTARRRWKDIPAPRRALLATAPLVVAANLGSSLRWSMAYSFQPQGRYLFPSVIAIAILLAGLADFESRAGRRLRVGLATAAFALGAWSLLAVALPRLSS